MSSSHILFVLFALLPCFHADEDCVAGNNDFSRAFMSYVGAPGTEHGRNESDPDYYTTNADIPQLPVINGFMGTAGTYRFMDVLSQTLIMIGEPKHGLWRYQENGFIREYRRKAMVGISADVDPNNLTALSQADYDKILYNYDSYIPEEGSKGYKYPEEKQTDGCKPTLNYIDLTIYHYKYGDKYYNHPAIDLPIFWCVVSQYDYPFMYDVWKYVVAQKQANVIGELGIRAGLDIKENYREVVRLHAFRDTTVWANIGVGNNATDFKRKTLDEIANLTAQTVNYMQVDLTKMAHEFYVVEKVMFNRPAICILIVMDNMNGTSFMSYIRPDGYYWEQFQHYNPSAAGFNTVEDHYPQVWVDGMDQPMRTIGLPVYGHHHPNREEFGLTGGACPELGGDMGHYPWGVTGGGFPSTYQEITAMCDGIVVDIKFWSNLDVMTWAHPSMGVGNAAFDSEEIEYAVERNWYGVFTDPYLVDNNITNPYAVDLTGDGVFIANEGQSLGLINIPLNFTRKGSVIDYIEVPDLPEHPIPPPYNNTA